MIDLLPTLSNQLLRILLRVFELKLHPLQLRLILHLFMQIYGHTGRNHLCCLLGSALVIAQVWALNDQILSCFLVERALELFLGKTWSHHSLLL